MGKDAIYVRFSDCGQHIRKWSREPFPEARTYAPQVEYICKCGVRVGPHQCAETCEF